MPYTHAGLQLERVVPTCIRIHQDRFTSCRSPCVIPKERLAVPDSPCTAAEHKTFRSLTCGALWACQTRLEELFNVVSLQTKLQSPTIKDLMAINTVIKRLKKNTEKFGIYYRKLKAPLRISCITDASAANKNSDFATEGVTIGLQEDRLHFPLCDRQDYLQDTLIERLSGKLHALVVTSTKSQRVSHSTSHAETLAAARGVPMAQIIGMRLTEPEINILCGPQKPLQLQERLDRGQLSLPVDAYVDCMDLWELCCGLRGTPQDKSQRLGILSLREERRTLRLRRLYHVRTKWMVSDMLTKYLGADSKSLLELTTTGCWTIGGTLRVRQGFGLDSTKPDATTTTS